MSETRPGVAERPERVSAGPVAGLEPGRARAIAVGRREIAVFNVEGELHAIAGRCLHKGGRLAEGFVRDGIVTCPLHWWRYDLRTGGLVGSTGVRLARFPVSVVDGEIVVEVPPEEVSASAPTEPVRERLLRRAREWEEARVADEDRR